MSATDYQVHGDIAVITMNHPPVNGLGRALRASLWQGLEAAEADPAISAVVIIGAGAGFSGGADIREFNEADAAFAQPSVRALIGFIEGMSKPVIAAIHGMALGGGLELALGCHFRVAASGAKIGLPEVKLGLLPGAGGTQRLPRVVGLEAALNMIVSGEPVASDALARTALIDEFVQDDLLPSALAFARKIVAESRPLKRVRDLEVLHPHAEALLQFARNTVGVMAKNFPAPPACVEAVAAAVNLPIDAGLRKEGELFAELMHTPESRALRHAFFAERAAAKIPDVQDDTPTRNVAQVAVVGAGTMGSGIAMNFLNAGIPVVILEMKQEALDRGVATMRRNYEASVKKGKLTAEKAEQRMALLSTTLSYDEIKSADLVIEAVFEDMSVKEKVFARLDAVMKPGAILASNTSTLDLDHIARITQRPQDVIGMHFFSPANVMKLLEVVRGALTAKEVLATVMRLAKKIKKTAVVSGVCDGFIGNRMLEYYMLQTLYLVEEGASAQQIDRVLEKFGMAMGPFRMSDLAGNDIAWAIRKRRYVEKPELKIPRIADAVCELGRYGQKTGAGWYRYEPGKRDALPDPLIDQLIAEHRKAIGITPRKVSDEEIVARCVYALVNEGARILEEGIAARASDIDMVYLTGYGFPLYRGGPMQYADEQGLPAVVAAMKRFARNPHDDAAFWQPAPLLTKLAAAGKTFNA